MTTAYDEHERVLMLRQPAAMNARIRSQYRRLASAHLDSGGMLAVPTAALLACGTVPPA